MNQSELLTTLSLNLKQKASTIPNLFVVAGFDGFVDEMISVVDERQSIEKWQPVPDIATFGSLISANAGKSGLREIVVNEVHAGGCSVNLGDGLVHLGLQLDLFATLGEPVHSAFRILTSACHSHTSWGREPGRTLAFEFQDGKLMFSSVSQLAEFNPSKIETVLSDGSYLAACNKAQAIAITNWSLFPHMTACWKKLQGELYAKLNHRPSFFFDLVDPSSRSEADFKEMLDVLRNFETYGSTILGVNEKEANITAAALGLSQAGEDADAVLKQANQIRSALGISQVVVHSRHFAATGAQDGATHVAAPFCKKPIKSTGAGDRFNAGYLCGHILGLPIDQCLAMGCASSGYFVRNAKSASLAELTSFIESWANEKLPQ